jgi:ketosteroid isomerase-like protein
MSTSKLGASDPANAALDAIEHGDWDAFLGKFTNDAEVWHNYDGADTPIMAIRDALTMLRTAFPDMTYAERRWVESEDGGVHQHVLHGTAPGGEKLAVETCWRVYTAPDGGIRRIEVYIDSAQAQLIGQELTRLAESAL